MEKRTKKIDQNRAEVLLEDLHSDFKAFGETLLAVKKKGEATFEEVGLIREEMSLMSIRMERLEKRVERIESKVDKIGKDMWFVKDELRLIRNELKQKISLEEFDTLEGKVTEIEKTVSVLS